MGEFIRDAGWVIYPVFALGLSAMFLAFKDILLPTRGRGALTRGFVTATVLMGGIGTAVGVQISGRAMVRVPMEQWNIFLIGLAESLNNLVAALSMAMLATLMAAYAEHRRAQEHV